MISFGILVGIYSYCMFFLGVSGILSRGNIFFVTLIFSLAAVLLLRKSIGFSLEQIPTVSHIISEKLHFVLVVLLALMVIVNLVGVFGPELSFDSLWYHLTLPKIYIALQKIVFIDGGLLYYSVMPKLAELMYSGALGFGAETTAKLTHFSFGLLTLLFTYKLARLFVSKRLSLLACVVFYANLVVGWESTTAYVDLVWSFYLAGFFYLFFLGISKKKKSYLFLCAVFLGLSITVKLVSVLNVVLFFTALILFQHTSKRYLATTILDYIKYFLTIFIVPSPWFIFSYLHTTSFVYPFFTNIYPVFFEGSFSVHSLFSYLSVFFSAPDPISPIYVIIFPTCLFVYKYCHSFEKKLFLMGLISIILFYFFPRSGFSRFLIPYLPLYSIIVSVVIMRLEKVRKFRLMSRAIIFLSIFVLSVSIIYRGVANMKYLPLMFGKETRETFLTKNLNFSFGDFYDTDNFFETHIAQTDRVLLVGFHNLYYVDFPFIDQSFVRAGDRFNYIAVQKATMPSRFSAMPMVYRNNTTGVNLYGGGKWLEY